MSDIVDRLRGVLVMSMFANSKDLHTEQVRQRHEAADEIERLRAEVDRLKNLGDGLNADLLRHYEEAEKLRAQRDELADALRKLIDDMHIRAKFRGDVDPDGTVVLDCGTGVLFAAKEALAKLEGKQ